MIKNRLGRELPEKIGDYVVRPYQGAYATPALQETVVTRRVMGHRIPSDTKLLPDLKTAIQASGLRDGMTISFHHSFREGDMIIGQVLTAIRELGIKHLRFAPSAVVNIKNPSIVDFVRDGTIDRIEASGIRGQLGDAVLAGEMEKPAVAGMDVERDDRHGRFADKSKDRRRPRFVLAPVQSVLPCGNFPGGEDDQQSSVLQVGQRLPHSAGIVPLFAVERVDIDEIVL